jgi:hypothetical protein
VLLFVVTFLVPYHTIKAEWQRAALTTSNSAFLLIFCDFPCKIKVASLDAMEALGGEEV